MLCLSCQRQFSRRPGGDGGVQARLGLGPGGRRAGHRGTTGRQRVGVQRSKVPKHSTCFFFCFFFCSFRANLLSRPASSSLRLHRVLQQVHQGLGTVDTQDQIAALEYVTHFVQSVCSFYGLVRVSWCLCQIFCSFEGTCDHQTPFSKRFVVS